MTAAAPEVLGVDDVAARYGLRDRRAVRKVMDDAGSFLIAGRLLVRRADLLAHEERLQRERRVAGSGPTPAADPRRRGPRRRAERRPAGPLPAGWWRQE